MIKVLQYGEGNFLRTFVDAYFDALNKEGWGQYAVTVVKPIPKGDVSAFALQGNRYHTVLRGVENGRVTEKVTRIECLDAVLDPFTEKGYAAYMALATDKELKIIVSNTTEAGIVYSEGDRFEDFEGISYPAKLTKLLYARFQDGCDGVYILPVELIDENARQLRACVEKYIALWSLPDAFARWVKEKNFFLNTLVDRIVSGHPRDEETRKHLWSLVGAEDTLLSVGEPFGLWAIEKKGTPDIYLKEGHHSIDVVLTDDIGYYKKRKVRVLNGAHTSIVALGLLLGKKTVFDCMCDERIAAFLKRMLWEEVIPFVAQDAEATAAFAESTLERFKNPYLDHRLLSIALNSISKWRARVLPSFKDYYEKKGSIAPSLSIGLSYLLALYSSVRKEGDAYVVTLPSGDAVLSDDERYFEHFLKGGSYLELLKDESVFGEDLTAYEGLLEAVGENIEKIQRGDSLL